MTATVPPDPALVDFGGGRRLERLGGLLVDRPHPAATGPRRSPGLWTAAAAFFLDDGPTGSWRFASALPDPWLVHLPLAGGAELRLHLRPAASGQIGIFLEQIPLWHWLGGQCRPGDRVLSLFAHTGGATLAMAAAGAEVFHIDASKQAIAIARDNARVSGLGSAAIHWVQEDVGRYCGRQLRRGERFRGILLDPPSYGHGPRGEAFLIDRDLPSLLDDLAKLLDENGFLLVSCHSSGWGPERLEDALDHAIGSATPGGCIAGEAGGSGRLFCEDDVGRRLDLGCFACRTASAFGPA